MQIGCKLGKFGPRTLFLALLLFASDLAVVFVKVAAYLLVLCLNVLEVLLASVEVVLPPAAVVTAVEFLDYSCHLCVVGHLAFLIPVLVDSVDP